MSNPSIAEVAAAVDKLAQNWESYKAANDDNLKKKADKGDVDQISAGKLTKIDASVVEAQSTLESLGNVIKLADTKAEETIERLDQLETAMKRKPSGSGDNANDNEIRKSALILIHTGMLNRNQPIDELDVSDIEDGDIEAMKAYDKLYKTMLRRGEDRFLKSYKPENVKLLSVGSDPDGGYWVRPDSSAKIIRIIFETSPIRALAAAETIGSSSLELAADIDEFGFGWVAEQEDRPETTTGKIKKIEIPVHEMYAEPRATQNLLDDAGFNVEGWVNQRVGEKFGRVEASSFVTGTGSGQPRGFLTYPAGTSWGQIEQTNLGNATTVTMDGLITMQGTLKSFYSLRATWLAKRTTMPEIRKLKDGQGRYLWEPSTQAGAPTLLLGRPIMEAEDMTAVAGSALALAYGDFQMGYQIVDRQGIRVLRDPFTAKPFIKFYTTRRVGGDVVNFEAIKIGKIAL